jgi:2'-5' RNA ligase
VSVRRLYTIAPLAIADGDRAFIDAFRARHDPQAAIVEPHFTLVFACAAVAEAEYLAHVRAVAAQSAAVDFSCRYAMLGADELTEDGYVYLVPDDGHAALSRLHDRLYAGVLAPHLRLDLPFTPHVTIGRCRERAQARQLCDELNATPLRIDGRAEALVVGSVEGRRFVELARCALA